MTFLFSSMCHPFFLLCKLLRLTADNFQCNWCSCPLCCVCWGWKLMTFWCNWWSGVVHFVPSIINCRCSFCCFGTLNFLSLDMCTCSFVVIPTRFFYFISFPVNLTWSKQLLWSLCCHVTSCQPKHVFLVPKSFLTSLNILYSFFVLSSKMVFVCVLLPFSHLFVMVIT